MALIKFGMMMTDARGKLGGHVFSKNRGGNYVRTNVVPNNPQTSLQGSIRSLFATISSRWSQLTAAQRDGWQSQVNKFERTNVFGDRKVLSGKALFQSLNTEAMNAEMGIITDAPAPQEIISKIPIINQLYLDGGALTLTVDATGKATAGGKTVVQATAPQTAGTFNAKNKFRTIEVFDSADDAILDLAAAYVDKFGTPAEGAKVFFRLKDVGSNGQASPYASTSGIVRII